MLIVLKLNLVEQEEPPAADRNADPFSEVKNGIKTSVIFRGKTYPILRLYEEGTTLFLMELGAIDSVNYFYDKTHLLPIGLMFVRYCKKEKKYFLFETQAAGEGFRFSAVQVKISADQTSMEEVGETFCDDNYAKLYKTVSKTQGSDGYFLNKKKLQGIIREQAVAAGIKLPQDVLDAPIKAPRNTSSKKRTSSDTAASSKVAKQHEAAEDVHYTPLPKMLTPMNEEQGNDLEVYAEHTVPMECYNALSDKCHVLEQQNRKLQEMLHMRTLNNLVPAPMSEAEKPCRACTEAASPASLNTFDNGTSWIKPTN